MRRRTVISRGVSLRFLFAMLVAVAMSFAPVTMPLGEASAVTTGHHAMKMADDGHCADQPAKGHADGTDKAKPCCAAGCMAAATLASVSDEAVVLPSAAERPALDQSLGGIAAEIATPPPRIS